MACVGTSGSNALNLPILPALTLWRQRIINVCTGQNSDGEHLRDLRTTHIVSFKPQEFSINSIVQLLIWNKMQAMSEAKGAIYNQLGPSSIH